MVSKEAEAAAVAAYFEFGRREGFEPFGYPLAAALEAAAPHIVAAAVAAVRADLAREFEERSDGWLRVPPYPNSPAGEKHAAAKAAWLAAAAIARGEL